MYNLLVPLWLALIFGAPLRPALQAADAPPPATPPAAPPIFPRAEKPPAIDGDPTDPCWANACVIHNFTQISSTKPPVQDIEARLCFDDAALYVLITCAEKTPAKLRADKKEDHGDVWTDDCVELFLRAAGTSSDYDQFIVNTLSVKQTVHTHANDGPLAGLKSTWQAQVKVGADRYVAEFAIPWSNLGLDRAPACGQKIELKIGREDHAGGSVNGNADNPTFANWPPNARYAHAEDYAPAFILSTNLIQNPTLAEAAPKGFARWNADLQPADAGGKVFAAEQDHGAPVIRIANPGHYVTISQTLRVTPGQLYRLHCETKGDGAAYLRARVKIDLNDKADRPLTIDLAPTPGWTAHDLVVPGSANGEALLILGCTENTAQGTLFLRNLAFEAEAAPPYQGPAIPVPVNTAEPFVIEALRPTDCRDLRGFIIAPIDGTTESLDWDAQFWEYNRPSAGQGVGYAYHNSDGLHLTFADARGIQAIQISGGIKADLVADCKQFDDPASGNPVCSFPGHTTHSLAFFDQPVATAKLSFFHVTDGFLSDINCFRAGKTASRQAKDFEALRFIFVPKPADTAPAPYAPWLKKRFPSGANKLYTATMFDPAADDIANIPDFNLAPGNTLQIFIAPSHAEAIYDGFGLSGDLQNCTPGTLLQIQVHDPLAPRTALTTVVVAPAGNGKLNLVLDTPDLILAPELGCWITVSAVAGAAPNLTLKKPSVIVNLTTREKALPECLAFRLTKLKGFYAAMSEARPWNGLYSKTKDIDAWIDANPHFAAQLHEIKDAIEYCHALDPQNDVATQYYEWFYRGNKKPPLPPAVLPDPATHPEFANAPDWAVAAHTAWMTAREVPAWWLNYRQVPTGELGGEVGDDTDQFGNYADFPMFETGGAAADLLDCAERLAETAEQRNLDHGLNRVTMDPLHAYEEGLNHESQMVWWHYGDPVYFERCIVAAKSLESLTTVTAAGHRHFKSQDCGAADLAIDRPLGVDGFAHNQMLHPLFEVLWYNRNPRALKFAREWGDAWLAHQKPGVPGDPAQPPQYAGMVDVNTDLAVPDSVSKIPYDSGFGGQQAAFSFLYEVTGDAKYLAPVHDFLATADDPGPWSHDLPELFNEGFLDDLQPAFAKLEPRSAAFHWLAGGDKKPFVTALLKDVAEIQHFRHMYTTAEPFTDRIFLYAITNAAVAYTGGYCTRNKFNHTHALSYEGFGTDYAALVKTARKDRVEVLLYNFADHPLTGKIRVWTLEHGTYEIAQGIDGDGDDKADAAVPMAGGQDGKNGKDGKDGKSGKDGKPAAGPVTQELWRHAPISVTLPSRQVVVLTITQKTKLDPIETRADLALSRREIAVAADGSVSGVAHNIGGSDCDQAAVGLYDAAGKQVARVSVGKLAAPLDLTPTRVPFTLTARGGLPKDHAGYTVRIFHAPGAIVDELHPPFLEIDGENNVVAVP